MNIIGRPRENCSVVVIRSGLRVDHGYLKKVKTHSTFFFLTFRTNLSQTLRYTSRLMSKEEREFRTSVPRLRQLMIRALTG